MICSHCRTPMMLLFSDADLWQAQCPKCGRAHPAQPASGKNARAAAQQAFSGWSYFINQYFDQAADAFRKACALQDCVPYAWAALLSDYGVRYIEEYSYRTGRNEYIVNFWKKDVPGTPLTDTAAFAEMQRKASFLGAEYVSCYQQDAELIDHYLHQLQELIAGDEPYHIFISYKDMDAQMRDTPEKLLMRRVAQYLSGRTVGGKPLRVFYAPVSLGEAHRPVSDFGGYIHAALRTAKLMIVVTSDPAFPSSPWVESEWKRFLRWNADAPDRLMTCTIEPMSPAEFPGTLHKYQSRLHASSDEAQQETTAKWFASEIGQRIESLVADDRPATPEKPKSVARFAAVQRQHHKLPPMPVENIAESLYRQGLRSMEENDADAAMECFLTAARHRHAVAMFMLGECSLKGCGTQQSPQHAVFWFDKAARRGYPPAMQRLGECLMHGTGLPCADPTAAEEWLNRATALADSTDDPK